MNEKRCTYLSPTHHLNVKTQMTRFPDVCILGATIPIIFTKFYRAKRLTL
jgi:hypothetical protein